MPETQIYKGYEIVTQEPGWVFAWGLGSFYGGDTEEAVANAKVGIDAHGR